MKLLFDCTELSYYLDNSGHRAGVFNVSLNLLREFIKNKDLEITFVCDFSRYYFMREVVNNIDEFKDIKLLEEHSPINKFWGKLSYYVDKMPIYIKYGIKILSRFYDNYFYKINKKNLEQLKDFDVYFSPFSPPSKEIERANILRVRMLHDAIPIIENGMPKSPKDWYYKIYNSINEKDLYVINSECTKTDILKFYPFIKEENIKTTYLGVGEKFTTISNKKDKTPPAVVSFANAQQQQAPSPIGEGWGGEYIFSLCSLGRRKNLIFAINNFYTFINKNKIDDLYLVLAGGVWKKFEKELQDTLAKYDKSKIKLLGYVPDEDLPYMYSNAMMFIFPSLYEGFGLPVLEAMACGCPVITSNTSSLPEVIGDAGIQINPTSNDEMIKAYEKMYFDSQFRENCKQKGLERAKQFSWKKCASELFEFIKTKSI